MGCCNEWLLAVCSAPVSDGNVPGWSVLMSSDLYFSQARGGLQRCLVDLWKLWGSHWKRQRADCWFVRLCRWYFGVAYLWSDFCPIDPAQYASVRLLCSKYQHWAAWPGPPTSAWWGTPWCPLLYMSVDSCHGHPPLGKFASVSWEHPSLSESLVWLREISSAGLFVDLPGKSLGSALMAWVGR